MKLYNYSNRFNFPATLALSAGGGVIFLALTRIHLMPADRDVLRLFMKKA